MIEIEIGGMVAMHPDTVNGLFAFGIQLLRIFGIQAGPDDHEHQRRAVGPPDWATSGGAQVTFDLREVGIQYGGHQETTAVGLRAPDLRDAVEDRGT